ncbi:hypothetical protein HAX54_022343, partial [Datura stramonium]|nr:hypothetical protein [Datura stramonium]
MLDEEPIIDKGAEAARKPIVLKRLVPSTKKGKEVEIQKQDDPIFRPPLPFPQQVKNKAKE